MRKIAIKDIAKKLNVSISSISRAFNDKYDINKETRVLILKTAEEMKVSPQFHSPETYSKKIFYHWGCDL